MLLLKLIANLAKHILRIKVRKSNSVKCYIRGGEPIYYHGPHKWWIIAGGPKIN